MNESGSPSKVCGRCGAKLPPRAPEGLCPRCLGALNLSGETVFTETETPRVPPPSPEQIGPHFPQLEILQCLGRGGMGVVYKARQKALGRLVALKLLAPEREKDPQFAERFAREAQALAQLNHPHIVTVYDFGQTNGFFYLLMEFVDGVNLRQLLRSRKLTPEEALAIVPPLCEALQFAHERGIVHRDIKPENLLLAKDGRIKVADFGIAKMLGDEAQIAEEKAAGTPGYMAPEQMEMSPRVDSRADIYSLGVVFYEMLTGELPANKFAPPSRKVAVDVRIDEVVLRALEKSPELRWQTAAEMRTSVEQVAASSQSSTAQRRGTAAASRAAHPSRWALLPLALLMAMVCGFMISRILRDFTFAPLIGGVVAFAVPVAIGVLVEGRHRARANGLWTVLSPWLLMGTLAAIPVLITAGYGALQAPAPLVIASPQPSSATPRSGAAQFAPGTPQPAVEATPVTPAPQFILSAAETGSANPIPRTSLAQGIPVTREPGVTNAQSRIPPLRDAEVLQRGLSEPSAPASDAARIRLRAAEAELKRASAQRDQGLISTAEYEAAETQFKLADAELRGDRVTAAEVKLHAAEKILARATVQRDQGIISNADYEKAAMGLELARAEERANAAQTPAAALVAADTAGIGVALKDEGGHFVIGSILTGSPAANEGTLKPGHEIREIGDSGDQLVSIAGWKLQDVVERLRGKKDTQVSLFVVQSGVGTIVTLIRQKLPELESGREHLEAEPRLKTPGTSTAPTPWEFSRYVVGAGGMETDLEKSPPLWVPSDPPMIVASQGQGLTAFATGQDGAQIAWQSHFDAAICAAPAWDAKSRRIYLGTTDSQFHALDAHGRRRWSVATGGKVVTQPVVANEVVVFGCDDHQVYGVNAETGVVKWTFGATASATSAPAITAGLVLIGSTDGSAHALDPQTGTKQWTYPGTNPGTNSIYAPILGAGGLVYLTTSGGEVVALDGKTGDTRWTAKLGGATDTAMAVGSVQLFVVEGGSVRSLDLASGRFIWQTAVEEYTGAPLVFDNSLMIARRQGAVRRLDSSGAVREEWTATNSDSKDATVFRSGPVEGGGALWLLDEGGAIWRLAPAMREAKDRVPPPPLASNTSTGSFNPLIGFSR